MDKKLNILKYLSSLFIIIGGLLVWNALTEILIFDKKIVIIIGIISFLLGYLFLIKEYKRMKIDPSKKGDLKKYFFNYNLGEIFLFFLLVLIVNALIEKIVI